MNGFTMIKISPLVRRSFALAMLFSALASTGCAWMQPANWRTMPNVFAGLGGPGGTLNVRSVADEDVTFKGGFEHGIYTVADENTATIILYDGPLDSPSQAVTIRMFWNPHAGRTPIDPTATNATIQYIVFPDNGKEMAIYSGAGYLYPNSDVGDEKLTAGVWQSSIRITDKTDGYTDRFGQARLEGRFTVKRDDLAISDALHKLNVLVRDRLGRTRLVDGGGTQEPLSLNPDSQYPFSIESR